MTDPSKSKICRRGLTPSPSGRKSLEHKSSRSPFLPTALLRPISPLRKNNMRNTGFVFFAVGLVVLSTGCNSAKAPEQPQPAQTAAPAETSEPRIYVTKEVVGDLAVLASGTYNVLG